MRAEAVRNEIQQLLRRVPFHPFVLTLENGVRIPIGHPENIAFDPTDGTKGVPDFAVVADRIRLFSTFEAVTSVSLISPDEEEPGR